MISNWMWLQFAPYIKSKSRRFLKKSDFVFFPPTLESVVDHSSQGRFFSFCYVTFSKIVIFGQKSDFWTRFFQKLRYLVRFGHIGSTLVSGPSVQPMGRMLTHNAIRCRRTFVFFRFLLIFII